MDMVFTAQYVIFSNFVSYFIFLNLKYLILLFYLLLSKFSYFII